MEKCVISTLVVVVLLATGCTAQFPGGMFGMPGVFQDIMYNVGQMSQYGARMAQDGMRRAQRGRRYGPGGRRYRTRDGEGYFYTSPDGSSSSYSYSFGSPGSHGFQYQYGPGGSYSRRW